MRGPRAAARRRPVADAHALELVFDRNIHHAGTIAAAIGAVWLIAAAIRSGSAAILLSCVVYAAGLLTMLLCSAAYNRPAPELRRAYLRRLDHAAIFPMIAGTLTPFSVNLMAPSRAAAATSLIWAAAALGAVVKLAFPNILERASALPYLALGWIAAAALWPVVWHIDSTTIALFAAGAAIYSFGALIYLWQSLPFHTTIWHGLVVTAASCHYAAIFHGVISAGVRPLGLSE